MRLYRIDAAAAESDMLWIGVAEPARAVATKVGSREFAGLRAWMRRELGGGGESEGDDIDAALQRDDKGQGARGKQQGARSKE